MSTTTQRVTARPTTTNVLKAFWSATPEEFDEGRAWYANANAVAVELAATRTRMPLCEEENEGWMEERARAVAVIAVLSPQVHWDRNVEMARRAYEVHASAENGAYLAVENARSTWPGLKVNFDKAIRILDGEKPEDVVSGPKVTAFYRAINDPTDPRGVVIDRHAFDVAVGRVMDDKTRGIVLGRAGAYDAFVRAYERATVHLRAFYPGITPAEVQAVTWVAWRRSKKES